MDGPYREHISVSVETPKHTYKYVLRTNYHCPICKTEVKARVSSSYSQIDNPRYILCHPLKRIVVKGFWWWRKYCPVEGVHHHLTCSECKVSWITMQADQSEANPDIKDAYL